MTAAPAVSIAIRAYRRRYLPDAIASVLGQTHRDFELIVYDDAGDLNGIVARLADPRVRYHRAARRTGPSGRFNAAVALCRGRYVGLLDDDDRYEPAFVERLAAALDRNPRAGVAFCRARWLAVGPSRRPAPRVYDPGPQGPGVAPTRWRAAPSTILLRREALDAAEALQPMPDDVGPDVFVNFRVALAGWDAAFVDDVLSLRGWHDEQVSRDGLPAFDRAVATCEQLRTPDPEIDRERRRWLAELLIGRALHHLAAGRRPDARADLHAARATDPSAHGLRRRLIGLASGLPIIGPGFARSARAIKWRLDG